MSTTSTVPSWISTAEQWAGYVGGLLTALAGAARSTSSGIPAQSGTSVGVGLSVDPLPEITAGMNLLGDAIKLGTTLQVEENSPAMIAAKAAQLGQNNLDAINDALNRQDLDALRKLSSL
jgi:hypothetical protein